MPTHHLSSLRVENVRVLEHAELVPAPGFNLISGANASGKTSLLEAIFLLSRGRSFRSARFENVVRNGTDRYAVYGRVATDGRQIALGLERTARDVTLRVNGRAAEGRAELSAVLPVQLIHPNSHRLLEDGPAFRRRYLDWGVFHVEPGFLSIWQRYQRALRQRNSALRSHPDSARAWDPELVATGGVLDEMRQRYVQGIHERLRMLAERLGGLAPVELGYQRGWSGDRDLGQALAQCWARDRERGHTGAGPHRADLTVRLRGRNAADQVSRGQQKLLVTAMILAQTQLLQERTGQRAMVLLDDLPAELDSAHREALLAVLCELQPQVFVTAIEPEALRLPSAARRFHVEHGQVREMV